MNKQERQALTQKITEHVNQLPPIPEDLDEMLHEAASPNRDNEKLKAIVKNDPGLCTELLHLAACSGAAGRPAETVDDAIDQAGLDYLVDQVGASYVMYTIRDEFRAMKYLDDYFAHSREIAATCPILAEVMGLPPQQRSFFEMAGVVHDIGRLVMKLAANETDVRLIGTSPEDMGTITDREKAVLGLNHCEVGEQVCERWRLSSTLREGVARHHTPLLDDNDFSFPGALLFLSHMVAGSDFTGQILAGIIPRQVFDQLGMTPDLFDKACRLYRERKTTD